MIAVIFEVTPKTEGRDAYLDIAAELRPLVERIDGFLGIERFESLSTPGKLLSLSWWRDEEAVRKWREMPQHRAAQKAGREELFANYRLRVAHVVRDYGSDASHPDASRTDAAR
jgi:heme-degrading monooxygenase HmoA